MQNSRKIPGRRISGNLDRRAFWGLAIFSVLCSLGLLFRANAQSVYENYTFLTLAGPGSAGPGSADGLGTAARLSGPVGVVRDSSGNLYVADSSNDEIRKIAPNGEVTTLAGLAGFAGTNDGAGAAARFNTPYGIALDAAGNVYVADSNNHTIRKISPLGAVTTLAGLAGTPGTANGTGSAARFRFPRGVAVDSSNNVYVADTSNDTIRKISPAGVVITFAGSAGTAGTNNATGTAASFSLPVGLTFDANGNLYVADAGNDTIRMIAPGAIVSTLAGSPGVQGTNDGTNGTAQFRTPLGIVAGADDLFVADSFNHTIRMVTFSGVVTTLAGGAGVPGSVDATGLAARFDNPSGITVDANTNLYVSDFVNDSIRQVTAALVVTTFAGMAGGSGSTDATGTAARFNAPADVAVDSSTNTYVADQNNDTIRKITPDGVVTTLAGVAGVSGTNDGTGAGAQFNNPIGLAVDQSGNIFVADTANDDIREVTPLGAVTTLAGSAGVSGTNNGTGAAAQFNDPFSVAVDTNGNIFVGDTHNHAIREIMPGGIVTTFAGMIGNPGTNDGAGTNAQFNFPEGVALDPNDNLYVVDDGNSTIRKISPEGVVSTFAGTSGVTGSADGTGTSATFNFPFGTVTDASGNVYVADTDNQTIRKITPAGSVTTIAGIPGTSGSLDGTGSDARFNAPEGLAVDSQGNVYVADSQNSSIRIGYPAPPDVPEVDFTNVDIGVTCHFSISNETTTSWSWTLIRQPSASSAQIIGTNTDTPTFTPDVEDIYIVQFQGWDISGHTVIHRLTLQAHNGNRLSVQTKGGGTVKPNLNGELLQPGTVYSMTAKPVPGSTFSNWVAKIGANAPFVFTNSPTISFAIQPDLALIANFLDHENPTIIISSPRLRQFSSNSTFTVVGTAKDNDQVANVFYRLNGGAWTNASGTTNWSAQVNLASGANTILAYAEDPSGNRSTTNHAALTYVPSAQMIVSKIGQGTIAPNFNGSLLAIGTNYTMTAKAATGYIFSNWVDNAGDLLTANPSFSFTMLSNTIVSVNFSPNVMFRAQGDYAGLFYDTNNLTATNAGFFSADVMSTGSFTAKMLLGGSTISWSGQFSTNGVYSNSVVAKGFSNPFMVQLQLDLTGAGDITGTISGSGWSCPLLANQDVFSTTSPPSQEFQRFALAVPGSDDSTNQPGGDSFGSIILDGAGDVLFTGTLADGSPATQETFLSRNGQWPFYISTSGGQGVMLGWLTFSPGQGGTLTGQVYWEKLPVANASLYPGGFSFTNGITILGSTHTFTFGRPSLNLPNGGQVDLQQAGLSSNVTNYFTLTSKDMATGTNNLKLTITLFTGVFKGTAFDTANNKSITINGVVLDNENAALGFFTNANQSGSVVIGP